MPPGAGKDPATEAARIFDRYAQRYAAKYMDVSAYHTSLDRFLAQLPPDAEVLELACGPGNVTKYLLSERPDLQILATDLAPAMLQLAQANNPSVSCQELDLRAITTLTRSFHGILCAFGLPYLNVAEADRLIHDAARMIRPGGVLYLSTMEGDPMDSGWEGPTETEQIYMNYHRAASLEETLNAAGFTGAIMSRATHALPQGEPVIDLMIVAKRPGHEAFSG